MVPVEGKFAQDEAVGADSVGHGHNDKVVFD